MTSLSLKTSGTVMHRQLFLLLKQQIANGEYRSGDRLPTQEALCEKYSVSRITVRRALADLQAEGLIRNEQGVGAFVQGINAPQRDLATLSFVDGLRRVVEETEVQVHSIAVARCPAHIAELLGLGDADGDREALHVVRTRSQDGVPVMYLDAWMPKRFHRQVTEDSLKRKPLYQLLTKGGKELGKIVQEINADAASPAVAHALQVDLHSPVLRITRLVHNKTQEPVQFLTIWSSPLRTRMLMQIDGDDVNTLSSGHLIHDTDGGSR